MNPGQALPAWQKVLAIVAHPDDESFGLGAVLAAFAASGSVVSVLCMTRGEASTLHGVDGDLAEVRAQELQRAAEILGVTRVGLLGYPDGDLATVPLDLLVDDIRSFIDGHGADGIVVFDPSGITGHPDHQRATDAAVAYARTDRVPILAWTLPEDVAATLNAETGSGFLGHPAEQVDIVLVVDRTTQEQAVACHPSQAVPSSVLWRRLELLGPREHLRWLYRPNDNTEAQPNNRSTTDKKEVLA